ncbi:D-alanyl-D-alanine carboxypeptidase/D-alanyl-D-alanine-endopeptidase [Fimbriiglobus ruber]|uniref:D-alanyl-D-alanine carboxypeptidase n=1 Tax=Fimbriiglobus ruber TaxID=1908690 RepID=A0A225DYW6_9BACT|nr:D-alanyl-D-alanine carboxypeptidase/D-alanyl-D-alanine-endopeptidase [Fimbriiglobus ruber]OWK46512.1 D-alanyl-D-alanine carboxypeptidase [Fimbriiglobus ruber]
MSGRLRGWAVVALVSAGGSLATPAARADDAVAKKLEAVMDGPDYKQGHWGVLVADAKTGDPVYARNADRMFAPASVTKLFTCAAAIIAFGPDHKFETPVYRRGEIEGNGVLRGDLILVAKGDLTFGSRTDKHGKVVFQNSDHTYASGTSTDYKLTDTDPLTAFDALAKQIHDVGINVVTGGVWVDDRLFESAKGTGSGPGTISPVLVNDNAIDLLVEPGPTPGSPAIVKVRPATVYFRTDFDVITGPPASAARFVAPENARDLFLRGSIPADSKPIVRVVPVERPADLARTLFVEALKRAGVRVTAPVVQPPGAAQFARLPDKKDGYKNLTTVATFRSPPLKEAIKVTLKVSHNLYASTLPCLVGVKNGQSTLEAGLREEGRILKELGLDVSGISFGGGAGGANADHVTPAATVQLLRLMKKRPEWEAYREALPILGVDGTLATSVPENSPARGKVFAKTGTLFWDDSANGRSFLTSKALAGVMTTTAGRDLVFAMFINDVPLPPGASPSREGKTLGKLCEILYENVK